MLNHPTVDKLHQMRLTGMARALVSQAQSPEIGQLSFDERLGLLVDSEAAERESRQNASRLKRATFCTAKRGCEAKPHADSPQSGEV